MLLAQAVGITEILVVLAYLMVTFYLGWLGFKRTKNAADYLIAGRDVHPFVMALSYGATFISTSAIVGFGGVAGMFGMSLLWLTFLNIFVGIFLAFVFLGGPTRRMGHRLKAHTFPELLGKRYQSKFLQIFAGVVIFLFIPLYAAAVLIGGCEFISAKFGVDYQVALLVFSVIIAGYVIVGGLKGVMYSDALQGSLMFIGMIALLIATYAMLGGVGQAHADLTEMNEMPSLFGAIGFQGWMSMPKGPGWGEPQYDLWWIIISTITLGVGIGVLAQPQLAVRFMTVKSTKELNRAVLVGGIFILIMTGVAFVVGSLSNLYFHKYEKVEGTIVSVTERTGVTAKKERGILKQIPCQLLHVDTDGDEIADINLIGKGYDVTLDNGKTIPFSKLMPNAKIDQQPDGTAIIHPRATSFLRSVVKGAGGDWMFNSGSIIPIYVTRAMPGWFGLIFLLTLLSAAMSTLSSQFHAVGTSIGRDVYEQVSHSKKSSMNITRIGIVIGIVYAVIISNYLRGGYFIARATAIFFGLCASAFLPAFVGGLFFKKITRAGAIASMLTGFLITMFWLMFIKDKEARALGVCHALFEKHSLLLDKPNWSVVDPVVVALPIAIIVAIAVSIFTAPPKEEHLDKCFGASS
ncbi:Proline permease [Anaerohalosphaera lusitana]|uniref:Proline permease n=1 Tax=Anaerohalosphaera lusitana TaxID=1936003 RepID=A0A1U9NRS7_9BACT|nr:sodium:solute symporter family protein [Anaerohalosphaera lusitana]AQT70226.1 Proline permease [Anaerohalosphaera lusitana]